MSTNQKICDIFELYHLSVEMEARNEAAIDLYRPIKLTKFPIKRKIVLKNDILVANRPRRTSLVEIAGG